MKLRLTLMVVSFLGAGCAQTPETGTITSAMTENDRCEITGLGVLPGGDVATGQVIGGDITARGLWRHESPTHGVVIATPDWVLCRDDGVILADFAGAAEVDGAVGYTYRVQIHDRGDGSEGRW